MGSHDIPVMPQPQLRPHKARRDRREMFKDWAMNKGGIVVYIPYPNDISSSIELSPVEYSTEDKELPGDQYSWGSGHVHTNMNGKMLMIAPVVKTLNKKKSVRKSGKQELVDREIKRVAVDVILPDMEIISGDSDNEDDVYDLLDKAFEWRD